MHFIFYLGFIIFFSVCNVKAGEFTEYLGCFQDQSNRTLAGKKTNKKSMTVKYCKNFCTKYKFYGVEDSTWCFCGNYFTENVRHPERECNMKCSGNNKEICGGSWRMNIYRSPEYNNEYLGCFQDQTSRTLADNYTNKKSMTVEYCRKFCTNFQFYGVQYSTWCFCGNRLTKNVKKPEGECHMKCKGNLKQICGGSWRMNIYKKPEYNKDYLGCFQDQSSRTLTGKSTSKKSMTLEYCRKFCTKFQFYGVQYSTWCFCGNFFTKNVRHPERECNMKCSGNNIQICGGTLRMNIYRNLEYNEEYLGCFQDQSSRTLAGKFINNKSVTLEYCKKFCTKFQFYGVQYSSWCFCGNSLTENVTKPERECLMECSGNKEQFCGGSLRMNVYRNTEYNVI
ncbi:uncharacterized protein LOC134282767 [Saccostrea cucullata]|uniref:uncharacterized protein LOC134282767 n=1 Tax=Saccostrea cuccullata TaxID=36930 RepID=UPI002ED39589